MVNVKVGDSAPDFTLLDAEMQYHSLHEFLGQKVVLAFFVGFFTNTCTMERCSFRDSMAYLTDLDAQVIGISVNDPDSNKGLAEKNYLPYTILSDSDREVIKAYGLETIDYEGQQRFMVAERALFLLDRQGIIRYMWVSNNPEVEPNYEELKTALKQIL